MLKFLTVRIDETLKRLEKRKKERDKRAAKRALQRSGAAGSRRAAFAGAADDGTAGPASRPCPRACRRRVKPWRNPKEDQAAPAQRPTGGDKAVATQKKQYFRRKKVCRFCVEKIDDINYKDVKMLHAFVAERGKIVPRRISGVCAPHQRRLTDAIKKARNIALLPFAASF